VRHDRYNSTVYCLISTCHMDCVYFVHGGAIPNAAKDLG